MVGGTFCTACGEGKAAAEEIIEKIPHNEKGSIAHVDATCTEEGVVGGKYCTVCNYGKEAAEETIDKVPHNQDGNVAHVDATCTAEGVVGGTFCTVCNYGKEAAEEIIEKIPHNQDGNVAHIDATCTAEGVVGGTFCTACGEGKEAAEEIIEKIPHNEKGNIAHVDATCTVEGVVGGTYCTACGYNRAAAEETIDKVPHNQDGNVAHVDATCTENGVVGGNFCTACNYNKTVAEAVIPAIGHNQDGSIAHVDATCTAEGVVGGTYCTACNYNKAVAEAVIPAIGHNQDGNIAHVDATCTETGIVGGKYCTVCNYNKAVAEEIIEKIPHNENGSIAHVDATCAEAGVVGGKYCTECNYNKAAAEEIIEKIPHNENGSIAHVDATCTETGIVGGTYCTACNYNKAAAEEIIEKIPHNENGNIAHVDATCTEAGVVGGKYCTECNYNKAAAEEIIGKIPHNENGSIARVDATCTATGVAGGKYCTVCNYNKAAAEEIIEKIPHNYEWKVDIDPTVNTEGVKHEECTVCHDKRNESTPIDKLTCAHNFTKTEAIAATCLTGGNKEYYTCSICNKVYSNEEGTLETTVEACLIAALGHNNEGNIAHVDATCTEDGVVGGTYCTACNDGKTAAQAIIVKLGHNNEGNIAHVDATCTENGVVGGTYCDRCNDGKAAAQAIIEKLGHNQDGNIAHVDATCTENGVVGGTYCDRCNNGRAAAQAVIGKLGHNTNGFVQHVNPTCTKDGVAGGTYCDRCNGGKVAAEAVIEKLGHNTNGSVQHVDATCTENGVVGGAYCDRCDEGKAAAKAVIEKLGHNNEGNIAHVDATCTENGVVGGTYCDRCNNGKAAAQAVIESLGHNTDGNIAHVDATCTEDGVVGGTYCDRCNNGKAAAQAVIEKLGHNADGNIAHVDATCTEDGVVGGTYCTACNDGKAAAEAVIEKLGHNNEGNIAHVDATCTEDGVVGGTYCTVCNNGKATAEAVIGKLGHKWTAATCTAPKTCSACNATEGTTIAHQIDNAGVCTVCGESFVRTITFQNGNTGNAVMPASISGIVGEEITLPTPQMGNYNFEGWYLDYACTVLFTGTTFSESLTLYAKWVSNTDQQVTVLSFNVNQPGSSTNATSVINAIKANSPDIVCVQEADQTFMSTLTSNLSGYAAAYWNVSGSGGKGSGLTNAIFVKSATFKATSSNARYPAGENGKVSYTENGTTYTANASTYVHYLIVTRLSDGRDFAIVNTQFDADGSNSHEVAEKIRQKELAFLWGQIDGIYDRGDLAVIVTGDFNSTSEGVAYQGMTDTYGFFDASQIAKQSTVKNTYTGNGGSIQDYIFVSPNLQHLVESYNVYETNSSDHNALIVRVAVPNRCPHKLTKTEATAATCLTAGNKEYYTCSICKNLYSDENATIKTTVQECIISALGHEAGASATCETAQTCTRCNYVFQKALGHAWTNACDTECNNACGTIRDITHDYKWVIDTEPTLTTEGVKHEECTVCHNKRNENTRVDKLTCTHSLTKTEATAATCLTAGNKEYYTCSICGKVYSNAEGSLETTVDACVIPALGHTWTDATCTAPKTCTECGVTEGESIAHTWADATCTAPKTCFVCNATEGEPIDHTWKDATCIAPKTCLICGTTQGELSAHQTNIAGICTICGQDFSRKITFQNGNTGSNAQIPAPISGLVGEEIPTLPVPKMRNYNFEGWYLDSACTKLFTGTTFSENLTLYAKWSSNTSQQISVMSFNVKTGQSGSNGTLVVDTILENAPNIFGVQEADSSWMSTLKNKLGSVYTCVGEARGGSIFDGGTTEHSAIFYRTDMFTCLESGTKWLSATPDKSGSKYSYTENGKTYTANYARILTYVVLQRKSDGAKFLYVNTHLDNNGNNAHDVAEKIRQAEIDIMMNIIKGITSRVGNIPVVVTGDFNAIPENRTAYNTMTKTYGYSDSSRVAKEGEPKTTFTDMTDENSGTILDYIFVSSNLKDAVETYTVCPAKRNGQWVSDHNAIIAKIAIPKVN